VKILLVTYCGTRAGCMHWRQWKSFVWDTVYERIAIVALGARGRGSPHSWQDEGGCANTGSMALLLVSDKAVQAFESHANKWSLDGGVVLTVVDYSVGKTEAAGDVVVWSDSKGLFGGAAVGVRDIPRDEDADRAYYGESHIISG
jgi:hypothetical protein